jgi:hypothetical protein
MRQCGMFDVQRGQQWGAAGVGRGRLLSRESGR